MAINSISFSGPLKKVNSPQKTQQAKQNNASSPLVMYQNSQGDTFTKQEVKETKSGQIVSQSDYDKLKSRNDEVEKHEKAHQAAGGSLAGDPEYEYNEFGYIQNGHVNISMPEVNKENPEESLKKAQTVKKSALAPSSFSELSDADLNVAAKAEKVIQKSQDLIDKKEKES